MIRAVPVHCIRGPHKQTSIRRKGRMLVCSLQDNRLLEAPRLRCGAAFFYRTTPFFRMMLAYWEVSPVATMQ